MRSSALWPSSSFSLLASSSAILSRSGGNENRGTNTVVHHVSGAERLSAGSRDSVLTSLPQRVFSQASHPPSIIDAAQLAFDPLTTEDTVARQPLQSMGGSRYLFASCPGVGRSKRLGHLSGCQDCQPL